MAEAELTTIARPYARAAFSAALDQQGGLAEWSQMLALLSAAAGESVVQDALDNPLLTTTDQTDLLLSLVGEDLTDSGKNFIGVLAEYDRLALLPTISDMFELLKANHEQTMEVQVISAFEVTDQESETLRTALKEKLQREISIQTELDESLIGGAIIRAEDTVIDGSVRGKLAKLSQVLS